MSSASTFSFLERNFENFANFNKSLKAFLSNELLQTRIVWETGPKDFRTRRETVTWLENVKERYPVLSKAKYWMPHNATSDSTLKNPSCRFMVPGFLTPNFIIKLFHGEE